MSLRVVLIDTGDVFAEAAVDRLGLETPLVDVLSFGRLADALELPPSFGPMLICLGDAALDGGAVALLPVLLARNPQATLLMLRSAADVEELCRTIDLLGEVAAHMPIGLSAGHAAPAHRAEIPRPSVPACAPERPGQVARLSGRETEIVLLLREGLSNKLIARRLDLSLSTVKTHVANIFRKIGAGNRLDAICKFADMHRSAAPDPLLRFREHMLAHREAAMFRTAVS